MPDIPPEILDELQDALSDFGTIRQSVADSLATQLGPGAGAALLRLFVAIEDVVVQGGARCSCLQLRSPPQVPWRQPRVASLSREHARGPTSATNR